MNATEADEVVRRIGLTWHHQLTDDEATNWRLSLAPVPYGLALSVLDAVSPDPLPPTPRRFLEMVQEAGGRSGPAPRPRRNCPLCGGNGWRDAEVAGGPNVNAVVRCSCVPPATGKHPRGCTCRTCIPDAGGEGPVGEPRREGPHPLEFRGVKPAPGQLL